MIITLNSRVYSIVKIEQFNVIPLKKTSFVRGIIFLNSRIRGL